MAWSIQSQMAMPTMLVLVSALSQYSVMLPVELPIECAISQMNIGLSKELRYWSIQRIPGYIFE